MIHKSACRVYVKRESYVLLTAWWYADNVWLQKKVKAPNKKKNLINLMEFSL